MPSPDLRRAGVYKGVAQAYRRKEQTMSREKQIEEMDEMEWITVEERWTETDGYYLVWNKEKRKIEIRFFHRLPPHYPVETYPEIRAYFGNCSDHKSITHWMNIPEPPKGERHDPDPA
jgi:hypothetical protein